jgi:hypothetical protein
LGAAEKYRRKDGSGPVNPSIFKPKQLVENFVEKIAAARPLASVLAAAKNAAPVQMLSINILFSTTYEQHPMRFRLKRSSPVRGLKASQTVRVLHKD